MKAQVISVKANGTWEAHDKTFHKFEITIGEHTGEYSTNKFVDKDADDFPFKVGQEAEYEYTPHEKFPKIKLPAKEYRGGHGKRNGGGNASFALSYAKDLVVGDKVGIDKILETATKLNNWLNDN